MSITVSVLTNNKTVSIKIVGRFDFSMHNEFRKSYSDIDVSAYTFTVDLSGAEYLDSSALGMLLLLKEHAESTASSVKITNCSNEIFEIFKIASFDKLFDIT